MKFFLYIDNSSPCKSLLYFIVISACWLHVCVCVHKHLFAWKKIQFSFHLIIIIISFVVHVYHSFIHSYMVTRIIWLFFFAKKIMFENCNLQMLQLLCCLAKQHRKIGQKKTYYILDHTHTCMHAFITEIFFFCK